MFKPPDNWDELKTFSEIFKNLIEALAVIGGLFGLWKWLLERKDRATDILLQLEQEFRKPEIMKGRQCIEEIERYRRLIPLSQVHPYLVVGRSRRHDFGPRFVRGSFGLGAFPPPFFCDAEFA